MTRFKHQGLRNKKIVLQSRLKFRLSPVWNHDKLWRNYVINNSHFFIYTYFSPFDWNLWKIKSHDKHSHASSTTTYFTIVYYFIIVSELFNLLCTRVIDCHTSTMQQNILQVSSTISSSILSPTFIILITQTPQPSPLLVSAPHQLITTRPLPPSHLEPQALGRVYLAVHEPEPVALEVVEVHPVPLPHQSLTYRKK